MSLSIDVYFAIQNGKVQTASTEQQLCQSYVKSFNRHRARGTPKAFLLSRKIDLTDGSRGIGKRRKWAKVGGKVVVVVDDQVKYTARSRIEAWAFMHSAQQGTAYCECNIPWATK